MQLHRRLETALPHIILRDVERSDIPAWYGYLQQARVIEHTSWNLKNEDDLMPLLENVASTDADSLIRLAIVDTRTAAFAGTIGFHTISSLNRTAELAYDLHPAYWGQGIAVTAAKALINWGMHERALVRVQATVLDTNLASRRVLEKLAFAHEGFLRCYRIVRDQPRHYHLFSRCESYPAEAPADDDLLRRGAPEGSQR